MKTIVRSVRIDEELWKNIGKVAKSKGKSRNFILVGLISNYCDKNSKVIIDKSKKM